MVLAAVLTATLAVAEPACGGKQVPAAGAATTAPQGRPRTLRAAPHVTVVAVTDWQATLKPCGCTVDLQKGGIERIGRWLSDLRAVDDSVVVVHAGSLLHDTEGLELPGKREQLDLRQAAFAKAMGQLGVAVVARSPFDVDNGGASVAALYAAAPFEVLAPQQAEAKTKAHVVMTTRSGVNVAVLAVTDDSPQQAALAAQQVALVRQQGAQVVVALCHAGVRGARRLARSVTGLDMVVAGHLDEKVEPLTDIEREGDTLLVHAARHGAWVTATTLVPDGTAGGAWRDAEAFLPNAVTELTERRAGLQQHFAQATARSEKDGRSAVATQLALPFYRAQLADFDRRIAAARTATDLPLPPGRLVAFQAVGLLWSSPSDPGLVALVSAYDAAVAAQAAKSVGAVRPVAAGQASYVGQATCLACHAPVKAFADRDQHGHAWQTLQDAAKTADLDCVPCHVTGFGKPGGSALGHLQTLAAVQCEACHGPGSRHVAAPAKGAVGHLLPVTADSCAPCHTAQHSPQFAFGTFRQRLMVPGHGAAGLTQ